MIDSNLRILYFRKEEFPISLLLILIIANAHLNGPLLLVIISMRKMQADRLLAFVFNNILIDLNPKYTNFVKIKI